MDTGTTYLFGLQSKAGLPGPFSIFASPWAHRDLIYRLARREVEARYKGSMLGLVWSVLVPLALMGVYTFIFAGVFHSQWDLPNPRYNKFFLIVFAALIVVNLFCACVGRAPTLMMANVNYIKKVIFPLDILPVVVLAGEGFDALMSTLVLSVGYLMFIGLPPITVLLIPVIMFPYLLFIIGMVWFVSALGVYLRDLRQLVAVILSVIGFLCPMFYSLTSIKEQYRWLFYINPLTAIVEETRHVLFYGDFPFWRLYFVYLLLAWAFAWLGKIWFTHAQRGFADVV